MRARSVGLVFIAAGLLAGAVFFRGWGGGFAWDDRARGARVPRAPAPTALEEAGFPAIAPPATNAGPPGVSAGTDQGGRTVRSGPKVWSRRSATRISPGSPPAAGRAAPAAAPAPDPQPSPAEEHFESSPDHSRPGGQVAGGTDSGIGAPAVDGAPPGQLPAEPGEHAAPEPSAGPAPSVAAPPLAPVLMPPALLSSPANASADIVRVILDRSLLTPQLRLAALEGRVLLAIFVGTDGTVAQVVVKATSGSDVLDEAAARAAEGWRFRPATRDGVPTESWAIIPVRFVVP